MYYDSNLIRALILLSILPEYLIVFLIFRRRLHREISWFTLYLLFDATTTLLGFFVYQGSNHYYYFYTAWLQAMILYTLAFMVIAETFGNLLAQYKAIAKVGVRLLFITATVLLIIAVISAHLGAEHAHPIMKILLITKRSVMLIQVGVVVVMFAFSSYFGFDWKHYQFGISLGFGLLASVRLALAAYAAEFGSTFAKKSPMIEEIAFVCTVLLWTAYFLRPGTAPPPLPPTDVKHDLERWNEALSELLKR